MYSGCKILWAACICTQSIIWKYFTNTLYDQSRLSSNSLLVGTTFRLLLIRQHQLKKQACRQVEVPFCARQPCSRNSRRTEAGFNNRSTMFQTSKQILRTRSSRASLQSASVWVSLSVQGIIDQRVKVWVSLMSRTCLMWVLHMFTLTKPTDCSFLM